MQFKLNVLSEVPEVAGPKINSSKTKVMRGNAAIRQLLNIGRKNLEKVNNVLYVGSMVCTVGEAEDDVQANVFVPLYPVWQDKKIH